MNLVFQILISFSLDSRIEQQHNPTPCNPHPHTPIPHTPTTHTPTPHNPHTHTSQPTSPYLHSPHNSYTDTPIIPHPLIPYLHPPYNPQPTPPHTHISTPPCLITPPPHLHTPHTHTSTALHPTPLSPHSHTSTPHTPHLYTSTPLYLTLPLPTPPHPHTLHSPYLYTSTPLYSHTSHIYTPPKPPHLQLSTPKASRPHTPYPNKRQSGISHWGISETSVLAWIWGKEMHLICSIAQDLRQRSWRARFICSCSFYFFLRGIHLFCNNFKPPSPVTS